MGWNLSLLPLYSGHFCAFFHADGTNPLHIVLGRGDVTAGLYLLKENIAAAGHFFFSYHIKYLCGHLRRMMLPDYFIIATHIALTYLDFLA